MPRIKFYGVECCESPLQKGSGGHPPLVTATIWLPVMELVAMCLEANCVRQALHSRNRQFGVSSLGMFASGINLRCLNSSLSGCGPGDRVTTRRYPNK